MTLGVQAIRLPDQDANASRFGYTRMVGNSAKSCTAAARATVAAFNGFPMPMQLVYLFSRLADKYRLCTD